MKMREGSNNKFVDFFIGTPKYNDDKDYADYAFYSAPLNLFFLACVMIHGAYLVIFSLFSVPIMLILDGVCVVLYAVFVILLKYFKGSWLPCTLVTAFVLFVHQICAVTLFGLSSGFHYLLIPLMFLSVFIRKKGKIYDFLRKMIIALSSVTFIFLCVYYNDYSPHYHLPYIYDTILLIMNCIVSFMVTAVYTGRVVHSLDVKRSQLDTSVTQKNNEIENMQNQIIISFANIIEARDGSTGKHVKRTSEYVEALVKELHEEGQFSDILDEKYMHDVMLSAPLHDIGKITIPDAILMVS